MILRGRKYYVAEKFRCWWVWWFQAPTIQVLLYRPQHMTYMSYCTAVLARVSWILLNKVQSPPSKTRILIFLYVGTCRKKQRKRKSICPNLLLHVWYIIQQCILRNTHEIYFHVTSCVPAERLATVTPPRLHPPPVHSSSRSNHNQHHVIANCHLLSQPRGYASPPVYTTLLLVLDSWYCCCYYYCCVAAAAAATYAATLFFLLLLLRLLAYGQSPHPLLRRTSTSEYRFLS